MHLTDHKLVLGSSGGHSGWATKLTKLVLLVKMVKTAMEGEQILVVVKMGKRGSKLPCHVSC